MPKNTPKKKLKYVSRPRLYKEESTPNYGGDYDYYAEVSFKLKKPALFQVLNKRYKLTHLIAFEGDFAIRTVEYLTSTGEYIEAPIPKKILQEMLELGEVAVEGKGKLSEMLFTDRIKHLLGKEY